MKQNIFLISLLFLTICNGFSQEEQINLEAINEYKYIIVPLKYEFLSDADQYQINSLTKFLFNKYGYTAFLENDPFPDDLRRNRCLALTAEVEEAGGFLSTKLIFKLLDCNNTLISTSKIGKTREKEHKVSYNLALRNAFETFQFYSYEYKTNNEELTEAEEISTQVESLQATRESQEEIERLKREVATLKEEKKISQEMAKQSETSNVEEKALKTSETIQEDQNLLYAQPISNGFQVVDSTPKVVMILLSTPKQNTFLVKDDNAIVYKEDGFWYLAKNDGAESSVEVLNIKF